MGNWIKENKKLLKIIVISIIAILLATYLVLAIINGKIKTAFDKLLSVFSPIFIGLIIAYLLNPICNFFENKVFHKVKRFKRKRRLSVLFTFICFLLILAFFIVLLIPNFLSAIRSLWITYILNYRATIRSAVTEINNFVNSRQFLSSTFESLDSDVIIEWVDNQIENVKTILSNSPTETTSNISFNVFSNENIKDYISTFITTVITAGSAIVTFFTNFILGIFISIYILLSKETLSAHIKRFLNAVFKPKKVRTIFRFTKLFNKSFGGFIEGKIVDSLIIGLLSYLVFLIFDMPNVIVLGTIVGVTNVIPIFGPIIGAIPCAAIVLLVEPEKTLLFILLVVLIQQLDGNVIGPKILGDKIHMSPLSVIISIVIMGGFFGIPGMLIGVPSFAVAIHILTTWIVAKLRQKGMETSVEDYYSGDLNLVEISNDDKNLFKSFIDLLKKIFVSIGKFFSKIFKKK